MNSWNQFIKQNKGSFLQSSEWADFQERCGNKVLRFEAGGLRAVLIKERFSYYIPYGPVFTGSLNDLFNKLKGKCDFLRIEPYDKEIQGRASFKRTQPQKTLLLDLNESEQELLNSFQKTCRYNIGLAQRKGLKVAVKQEYDPVFYQLLKSTARRNDFKPFNEDHYKKLFLVKSKDFDVNMFLGKYQGKTIAAYIMVIFNNRATALHGSFDMKYKKLKPANLMVWERIRYAKQNGCSVFDFWGIDEKRWPGFTEFKKSFSGKERTYPKAVDIVFSPLKYKMYRILKKIL